MDFDADDMEVIVLSTKPPELSPSEVAHLEVLRARCRYLRRCAARKHRSTAPSRRLRWLVSALLAVALADLVLF